MVYQPQIRPLQHSKGKMVKVADSVNAPKLDYPIFCFKHIIKGYQLDDCDKSQKALFISKLVKMSQQTWNSLLTADHKSGAGFEHIPIAQVKGKMPVIITEDVEKVLVMRFKGRDYRIIGHRSDHIFHITHVDTKLSAYSH